MIYRRLDFGRRISVKSNRSLVEIPQLRRGFWLELGRRPLDLSVYTRTHQHGSYFPLNN